MTGGKSPFLSLLVVVKVVDSSSSTCSIAESGVVAVDSEDDSTSKTIGDGGATVVNDDADCRRLNVDGEKPCTSEAFVKKRNKPRKRSLFRFIMVVTMLCLRVLRSFSFVLYL